MKKIIIAAGVLALAGCSYVLPQSSQTKAARPCTISVAPRR